MKSALLIAALVAAAVAPCHAQQPRPHEAEFRAFYANFLAAVRANNKEKIADMIVFPVKDWSVVNKGNVQTIPIKDRAEFLAKYYTFFTTSMRAHIPKAKLDAMENEGYLLGWHDVDTESGLEFAYIAGTGYRIRSFTIGPR